jgi:hypothetical protein
LRWKDLKQIESETEKLSDLIWENGKQFLKKLLYYHFITIIAAFQVEKES